MLFRSPGLTVGFELDRTPYADREPAPTPTTASTAMVSTSATTPAPALSSPTAPSGIDIDA